MGRDRAWRRAQRARLIKNRIREAIRSNCLASKNNSHAAWVIARPGRVARRKPFDCGQARCMTCHAEKILGRERYDYRSEQDDIHEQLR